MITNNECFTYEQVLKMCASSSQAELIHRTIASEYRRERFNNLKHKRLKQQLADIWECYNG